MTLSHLKENNNYIILTNKKSNEIEGNKEILILMYVKGQSNEIFHPNFFFSSFEPAWATDQCVKIFSILVKFSLSYSNFFESPCGIILCRVNLPRVSYPGQSRVKILFEISPGYDTLARQSPWGIILRRVNLPGKSMRRDLNQVLQIQLMLYLYNFSGWD